jgi:hypothetical protein
MRLSPATCAALCPKQSGAEMKILLVGGVGMLLAALILAWLATFARIFPVGFVKKNVVKSYERLLKAHIDFLLMSLFCFAFYAVRVPLPEAACWLVVIGGFSNPGLFVIGMVRPDAWKFRWLRVLTAASFVVTTIGFAWVGYTFVCAVI